MLLGGYIAVALNDVVRALIMLVGLVLLPVIGIVRLGGPGRLLELVGGVFAAILSTADS